MLRWIMALWIRHAVCKRVRPYPNYQPTLFARRNAKTKQVRFWIVIGSNLLIKIVALYSTYYGGASIFFYFFAIGNPWSQGLLRMIFGFSLALSTDYLWNPYFLVFLFDLGSILSHWFLLFFVSFVVCVFVTVKWLSSVKVIVCHLPIVLYVYVCHFSRKKKIKFMKISRFHF